jgi:hypothetical protein
MVLFMVPVAVLIWRCAAPTDTRAERIHRVRLMLCPLALCIMAIDHRLSSLMSAICVTLFSFRGTPGIYARRRVEGWLKPYDRPAWRNTGSELPPRWFSISLISVGSDRTAVVRALRESYILCCKDGESIVDSAPCLLVEWASSPEAEYVCRELQRAGAEVEIVEKTEPNYLVDLVLHDSGPFPADAVDAIARGVGVERRDAEAYSRNTPATILRGVSIPAARIARARLESALASAEIRPCARPVSVR